MMVLGAVLALIGYFAHIPILITIGLILLVLGAVLFAAGALRGHPVGGRYYW